MSASFIKFGGVGFWTRDGVIERFAGEVATALKNSQPRETWTDEVIAHLTLQSTGVFNGWVHLSLDEFLDTEEKRERMRHVVALVGSRYPVDDPLHQTGALLMRLLDGQITTTADGP